MSDPNLCYCGGGSPTPHAIGGLRCYREWVEPADSPQRSIMHPDMWVMPGGYEITDTTLHDQRCYHYHREVDRWSRTKDHESMNSLEA